jgi:hypothetical protein
MLGVYNNRLKLKQFASAKNLNNKSISNNLQQ